MLYVPCVGRLRAAASACVLAAGTGALPGCDNPAASLSPPPERQLGEGTGCAAGPPYEPRLPYSTHEREPGLPYPTHEREPGLPAVIEQVRPVVVTISTMRASEPVDDRSLLGLPFGRGLPRVERAIGSGFLVTSDGLVVTNDHVVGQAYRVEVRLSDDRAYKAIVIGRDPLLDVALLRLSGASGLHPANMGESASVRLGDDVVVIGNPLGLGPTVTRGVVSATSRSLGAGIFEGFIQTDAAINPGNSGGPIFDAAGQVIGMVTAIHAEGRGISFALPIDEVLAVLPELRDRGYVRRGRLGLSFQEVSAPLAHALKLAAPIGALVTEVEPDGPAARCGLRPGDVITSAEGRHVHHARVLAKLLRSAKPGDKVRLVYRRSGAELRATVVLSRVAEPQPSLSPTPATEPHADDPPLGVLSSDAAGGARIDAILPPSPAAGSLEVGDIVLTLNGAEVHGSADLSRRLSAARRQGDLLLRIRRGGAVRYLVVPAR